MSVEEMIDELKCASVEYEIPSDGDWCWKVIDKLRAAEELARVARNAHFSMLPFQGFRSSLKQKLEEYEKAGTNADT